MRDEKEIIKFLDLKAEEQEKLPRYAIEEGNYLEGIIKTLKYVLGNISAESL